jgi:hypothetical protein
MRLIELELVEGKTVWLNPERVTMIAAPHMDKGGTVIGESVILVIGAPTLNVRGGPEEIVKLLTDDIDDIALALAGGN